MSNVALIVVDVQKAYHESEFLKKSVDFALYPIGEALEIFRKVKRPIFFVQHDGGLTPKGSPGFELTPALCRKENEYQIIKQHPSSFFKTNLKEKLAAEKIEFVVVCGLSAQFCINATMQGAYENGFKASLLQHGVAGMKPSHVEVALETCPVISVEALEYFIGR